MYQPYALYIYIVYNNIDARYSIIVFNYIFIAKFQLVIKLLILDVKDNLLLSAEQLRLLKY